MAEEAGSARPASFRDVLVLGEFRALWAAHLLSVAGDQIARVALALLVFDRTASPAWTALTYAVTFLPDLLGGPLLTGLADRLPRRAVMVAADLARAGLVAVMALPGVPVSGLIVLLFAVQLLAPPFAAARAALLPVILPDDLYLQGSALMNTTYQAAMLGGFPIAAALVVAAGTGHALLADAATFAVSAVLIRWGVRERTAATVPGRPRTTGAMLRAGVRLVAGDRRLRTLLSLACLSGFYIAPEALAVPYAAQIGAGTLGVGWLLAANPAGTVAGMLLLARIAPARRLRLLGPLAVATSAVLLPTALAPGLVISVALWALCGMLSAHDMVTNAAFVQAVPDGMRGQAFGLASTALRVAQGLGIVLAGLAAQAWRPAVVIGGAATLGVAAAGLVAVAWRRAVVPRSGPDRGKTTSDGSAGGADSES